MFLILIFFVRLFLTFRNVGLVLKDIHLDRSSNDIWPVLGNICGATGHKDTAIKFLIKIKMETENGRNEKKEKLVGGKEIKEEIKEKI